MPNRIVVDFETFSEACPDPKATGDNAPHVLANYAQFSKIRDASDDDVEHAKAHSGWGYLGFWTDQGKHVLCLEADGALVREGRTPDLPAELTSCA